MPSAHAALLGPLGWWFSAATSTVPEPYLDEFFHVRQAQHYCDGHFDVWDPKITTPPGLYFLSYLASPLLSCKTDSLRSLNAICVGGILLIAGAIYTVRRNERRSASLVDHCAFNIATFPPLFFFAVLYYTDVTSTLSVLIFYWFFLRFGSERTSPWVRVPLLVAFGLISLLFRQTNIFWVAIFPAGLVLVNEIDRAHDAVKHSAERHVQGFGDSFLSVLRSSYKLNLVYDPPVRDAALEDYVKTIISIVTCLVKTITQPHLFTQLISQLIPYVIILTSFTVFVAWNGGVVLGDKSNHVATLHLAQMLYLWPYITFFSWPLIWPYLLTLPMGLLAQLSSLAPLETMLIFKRRRLLPRVSVLVASIIIACAIAHFNTIVHPFTLADNRHYTFYVFRLLTRPFWIKYAVTPVYVICAWACLQALGARPTGASITTSSQPPPDSAVSQTSRPLRLPDGVNSTRLSFVLIWLATTALQLITAPLVEPRYFILPWVFWRLHLPLQPLDGGSTSRGATRTTTTAVNSRSERNSSSQPDETDTPVDFRLWLETAWHLSVHATTAYIFLKWGFTWPQEPGAVQRFMW